MFSVQRSVDNHLHIFLFRVIGNRQDFVLLRRTAFNVLVMAPDTSWLRWDGGLIEKAGWGSNYLALALLRWCFLACVVP